MALEARDLVSIFDLSDHEIEALFDLADEFSQQKCKCANVAEDAIL